MQLTSPPEMTTALTDAALGVLAVYLLIRIRRLENRDPLRISLWSWIFGVLAAASFYGTIAHAVVMRKETLNTFWMPLSFLLGMMVSLFVAAVVYDWKGERPFRKVLPAMLALGAVFFAAMFILSRFIEGYFIVFIAYSCITMLFSLAVYTVLGIRGRNTSALMIAGGILLILAGSVVQAQRSALFSIIWAFDYNSVYHFFMMGASLLIYKGVSSHGRGEALK